MIICHYHSLILFREVDRLEYIEFSGLNLRFEIGREAFKIFSVPIYWYGIFISIGFMLAVILALKNCKRYGIDQDTMLDIVLYATPVAIISARLFYVIFSWDNFRHDILQIFNTRNGGLAIYGGVIGALGAAYIITKIKKVNFFDVTDLSMPYFLLAQAIGRWGNFINQEAYGTTTDLPWGMNGSSIIGGPVHPTFLYESIWNLSAFLILIWARGKQKFKGEILFLYLALYGLGRAWIEPLRTDSLMLGSIRINQLLAFVLMVTFFIIVIVKRKRKQI